MESENNMNLTVTARKATSPGGKPVTILDLEGEVDVYTSPVLRQEIMDQVDAGTTFLVADLAHVPFMDSTGLGILIGGVKRMKEMNGKLILTRPTARITRVLDITGLATVFTVAASEADALALADQEA